MSQEITRLQDGVYFVTLRAIYWNIPQVTGDRVEWRVPAGTRGHVVIDTNTREVGYVFDGLTHPNYGVAPTIRKPGMNLPEWATPIDKMKGTHDQSTAKRPPVSHSGVQKPTQGRGPVLPGGLGYGAAKDAEAGSGRGAGTPRQPGTRSGSESGAAIRPGAARA